MQLVKVDVIGLQPLERSFDRMVDVFGVENRPAAPGTQPVGVAASGDLGGDNHLVAVLARGDPASDDALSRTLSLPPRRDGIDFRRVNEVDAALEGVVQLRMALGLAVLFAPGH